MSNWLTPEEMERKRKFKKRMGLVSLPFAAILFSALITVLLNKL
ncbi:hypothetical protein [Metabacillus lacus]|nr:hypothetical protein [Metabacillus lacus]